MQINTQKVLPVLRYCRHARFQVPRRFSTAVNTSTRMAEPNTIEALHRQLGRGRGTTYKHCNKDNARRRTRRRSRVCPQPSQQQPRSGSRRVTYRSTDGATKQRAQGKLYLSAPKTGSSSVFPHSGEGWQCGGFLLLLPPPLVFSLLLLLPPLSASGFLLAAKTSTALLSRRRTSLLGIGINPFPAWHPNQPASLPVARYHINTPRPRASHSPSLCCAVDYIVVDASFPPCSNRHPTTIPLPLQGTEASPPPYRW